MPRSVGAPGGPLHLTARFLQSLDRRGIDEPAREWVAALLDEPEQQAFFAQSPSDQRHGVRAGRHVAEERPDRRDLIRAALLHDLGKRHARLGVVGRVLASAAMALRLPLRGRWSRYRDHGEIGAGELERLGAEALVVAFARCHHGPRPDDIPEADWALLEASDRVRG